MSIAPEQGVGPSARASSPWTEHRNAQGRVYWYHQVEKRSVWEKPTELRTARERAIDSTPWKEYQSGERKYYVHSVTKESSWTVPEELKDLFDSIPDEASPAPGTPGGTVGGAGEQSPAPGAAMSPASAAQRPVYTGPPPAFASPNGAESSTHSTHSTATPAPQQSFALAAPRAHVQLSGPMSGGEDAFMHLLKEKNVDEGWTWEQTMREIITEPLYKALATLAERKAAFSKYITNLKEQEMANRRDKAREIEPKVRKQMQPLIDDGRVKAWLSYDGMLSRYTELTVWKALEKVGLNEAKELWAIMQKEMRDQDASKAREVRHRNMDLLMSTLRTFEADVTTRWKDARQTVLESNEWKSDAHLSTMDLSDMIIVFDEYMKSIEKEKTQEMKEKAHKRKRQDRQMRDWFRAALQEGKQAGWLHAKTDFGDVYQRFKGHDNMAKMLGQPGSTPLDLFFDVIDELERELKVALQAVESLLAKDSEGFRVEESTRWEEFEAALARNIQAHGGETVQRLGERERKQVWEELQRVSKEEKRRSDRKLRHLSEDLRYALKKAAHHRPDQFESEDELGKAWPDARAKLEALRIAEWQAFDEITLPVDKERIDEARRGAWERFVKRQREKMEERLVREKERQSGALSDDHGSPRKRRGEEAEEEERRRSSRRAGRHEEDDVGRTRSGASRKERRAGEIDEPKERERREKRRGGDDFEAVKRQRREEAPAETDEAVDSEKEEGEV